MKLLLPYLATACILSSSAFCATHTTTTVIGKYPVINDNGQIAFQRITGPNYGIFLYDAGTAMQIVATGYDPDINNRGEIVWHAGNEIYLWSGSSASQISQATGRDLYPSINDNGHVLWQREFGNSAEIVYWDTVSEIQVTTNSVLDSNAVMNTAGSMVWERRNGTQISILQRYVTGGTVTVLNEQFNNYGPDINENGHVVWAGKHNNAWGINLWDGSQVTQIATGDGLSDPQINNLGHVVWEKDYFSIQEIYFWDGSTPQLISDPADTASNPSINNFDDIVWETDEELIYYAFNEDADRSGPVIVPEPSTLLLLVGGLIPLFRRVMR